MTWFVWHLYWDFRMKTITPEVIALLMKLLQKHWFFESSVKIYLFWTGICTQHGYRTTIRTRLLTIYPHKCIGFQTIWCYTMAKWLTYVNPLLLICSFLLFYLAWLYVFLLNLAKLNQSAQFIWKIWQKQITTFKNIKVQQINEQMAQTTQYKNQLSTGSINTRLPYSVN